MDISEQVQPQYDVVIVGAGISGLAAAYQLKMKAPNLSFVILEATSRLGGRTLSVKIKNATGREDILDLGAHWVSSQQPHMMDLLQKLGIEHYRQNVSGKKLIQVGDDTIRSYTSDIPNVGSWLALLQMHFLTNKGEKLIKEIDTNNPYASKLGQELDRVSADVFVREATHSDAISDLVTAALRATLGCEPTQVSMLYCLTCAKAAGGLLNLLMVKSGAQEFRVKGGTQQITEKLLNLVGASTVRYGHAVSAVTAGDLTEVVCADGTKISCRQVIMTVPPNMVAKMEFRPQLPKQQWTLFTRMGMGNLVKVFLIFEKAFWTEKGLSGEVISTGGPSTRMNCERGPVVLTYSATTANGTPALVCFIGGKNADQWLDQPQEVLREAILSQLENYFGSEVRNPFKMLIKDWRGESFIGGAPYNYVTPGNMHNYYLIHQPHKSVHFAGASTATQWCGYMSGAVEAGYRAAAEVVSELEPDLLSHGDQELLSTVHRKRGFPYSEPEWVETTRRIFNSSFFFGIGLGILLMLNLTLILRYLEPLLEYLTFGGLGD